MRVEIDQSGKVEDLSTPTIVAYSNGLCGAIKIDVATKRRSVQYLHKTMPYGADFAPELFAVVVYILIENLPVNTVLIIDEEYTGKERIIAEKIEGLLLKKYKGKWCGEIRFGRIGKHSKAHYLAWELHRKNRKLLKLVKIVKEAKILDFFK